MHILYVDESGDDGFSKTGTYSHNQTPTSNFIRCGIVVHDRKWLKINRDINKFKYNNKIPVDVELHATEILNGQKKKWGQTKREAIPNWYGVNYPNRLDRYNLLKEICNFILSIDITVFFIAIDKRKILQTVTEYKKLPKRNSWEFLIERYNLFLDNQEDKKGIIISDAVTEVIENEHRNFAKVMYANSMHIKEFHFIESILFEPSESSNLLQISDVVSYSLGRMLNSGDDTFYNIIQDKIFKYNGKIDGYGLKFWPE